VWVVVAAAALALSVCGQERGEDEFGGGDETKQEPEQEPAKKTAPTSEPPKERERSPPEPARSAQPEELGTLVPVAFAERPLVQPHRSYEVFVELPLRNVDPRDPTLGLLAGARHGFAENLELGVIILPLVFYKGVEFSQPSFFATYRLIKGTFELGGSFLVSFPIGDVGSWTLEGGVPMLLHGGDRVRVDVALRGSVSTDAAVPKRVFAPVLATLQIARQFRVAVESGAEAAFTGVHHGAFEVPIGVQSFFTIDGSLGAAVDLGATFRFPALFDSSAEERVSFDHWIVSAVARFYAKAELNPLDEPF
jgi:hypothetical protein